MPTDFRFALRALAKSPGFACVSIFTVALGLASVTAIFSVANGVLFRPLPFRDESSLAWIWSTRPDRDRAFFSIPNFLDLRRQNTTTADLAAVTPLSFNLTGLGEPERAAGWRVTANLFPILGAEPGLGRLPSAADDTPGAAPVAVLGCGYWRRRFGGDPGIVGRTVTLNGTPHVIVGVLPDGFVLPHWETDIVVAQSLESDARRADRGTHFLRGVARLKSAARAGDAPVPIEDGRRGAPWSPALAEFTALTQRLVALHPDTNATITAPRFVPLRDEIVGDCRASILLLLGSATALLLIMCANLAGLLSARALSRRRDAALCSALGSRRGGPCASTPSALSAPSEMEPSHCLSISPSPHPSISYDPSPPRPVSPSSRRPRRRRCEILRSQRPQAEAMGLRPPPRPAAA